MIFQLSNITVTGGLKDLPLYLLHKNSDNNLFLLLWRDFMKEKTLYVVVSIRPRSVCNSVQDGYTTFTR
jgi:hypothetical protein